MVGALLGVDLLLYAAGNMWDLGFSPEVWGTYSSWANAIFPAFGLLASVHLWISDRTNREKREAVAWASMIRRQNGAHGTDTTLRNHSPTQLQIVGPAAGALRGDSVVCMPSETKYFRSPVGVIGVEIAGHVLEIREDGLVKYLRVANLEAD